MKNQHICIVYIVLNFSYQSVTLFWQTFWCTPGHLTTSVQWIFQHGLSERHRLFCVWTLKQKGGQIVFHFNTEKMEKKVNISIFAITFFYLLCLFFKNTIMMDGHQAAETCKNKQKKKIKITYMYISPWLGLLLNEIMQRNKN